MTQRSLVVTTPAAQTALTTLDSVKTELGITGVAEDAYLQAQIARTSALICTYLGVVPADDGTVTLGREALLETIYPERGYHQRALVLSRRPVSAVASVTEDDDDLVVSTDYLIRNNAGLLLRQTNGFPGVWLSNWSAWTNQSVVIAYTAGWLLPGEDGRNLPLDIEAAAIGMVKAARFQRMRDPTVKSETTDGIDSVDYFFGSPSDNAAFPQDVVAKLNPFRVPVIG